MSDDNPWYSPTHKLPGPRAPQPGQEIWRIHANGVFWSAELRFHGETYAAWECQILRDNELWEGHSAFQRREDAIAWGDEMRRDIERGWNDD
jgi:hypothetical protein